MTDYSHLPDFRSDDRKELDRLHAEIARLRASVASLNASELRRIKKTARVLLANAGHRAEIARLRAEIADFRKLDDKGYAKIEHLRAELAAEKEQTKIMLDSYAAENQRLSDERDAARQALQQIAGLATGADPAASP